MTETFKVLDEDWNLTSLDKKASFPELDAKKIDDFLSNNILKSYSDYKKWVMNLERVHTYSSVCDHVRNFMEKSGYAWLTYIEIDNSWAAFRNTAAFKEFGISTVYRLASVYFETQNMKEKFANSNLLFLPITKRLSVIVCLK